METVGDTEFVASVRPQRVASHQLLGNLFCEHRIEAASYVDCRQFLVLAYIVRFELGALTLEVGPLGISLGYADDGVAVLVLNRWRCPLTSVAARYTADRRANFDIYLPEWLATHNKSIFGALYFVGVVFVLVHWLHTAR
jgi:hypothetical protein